MALVDSVDKIVTSYFAVVARQVIEYKGKRYTPKPLQVSPSLLRGFTCPEGCAGCCPRFSLDYLPTESLPYQLQKRVIEINHQSITVFSDQQKEHLNHHCKHVNSNTGRCEIHGKQPFSCDFELIRTAVFSNPKRPNILGQRLFGRGWAMLRVDGARGAFCTMTTPTQETVKDVARKLERLNQWADWFGIKTWVPDIISCIESKALHRGPVLFTEQKQKGFEL